MENSIKHSVCYFGAHKISVKSSLCPQGCPSSLLWPRAGELWHPWPAALPGGLPRASLTCCLRGKKHNFSSNEHQSVWQSISRRASPPPWLCPLLCVPPGSQLSPSAEAQPACSAVPLQLPGARGQPYSTGGFATFILSFTICLPRCLLLLQLLPGDSATMAASFPRPRTPRSSCRPMYATTTRKPGKPAGV